MPRKKKGTEDKVKVITGKDAELLKTLARSGLLNNVQAKEYLNLNLERLYRLEKSCNKKEGTGLGLAIVKTIVELHNGEIEVSSTKEGLVIDVYVIVGYGIKISEVAFNVMQKVTYVLENNAELPVASVNVNVKGVKVLKDI